MTRLLTASTMRGIETQAIEAGGVTGRGLMESAGRGVADAIAAARPRPGRASVLCGPGNNGGDGFVVARLLGERGWRVEVFLWGDAERLPPDASANCEEWRSLGPLRPWSELDDAALGAEVIVDAVFGAGQTRAAPEEIAAPFGRLAGFVVAVDCPTGLCMDSGRVLDAARGAVRADLTVTFHAPRLGHYLAEGPEHCGRIVCVDIGLPGGDEGVLLVETPLADLGKRAGGHKYHHGHALLLCGGPGRGGAIRMAARAALRAGAGLVTVGCPPDALLENASRLDAIMLRAVHGAEGLAALLEDPRFSGLCLGPGLGVGERTCALVLTALAAGRPTVLDADALTSFAGAPGELFAALRPDCLLTPHDGEFGRLFPDIAERLTAAPARGPAMSRFDATREAALRAGCHVLLKGPDTVIAAPDGTAAVHAASYDRAAPWLATAGAGDVLAGLVTGLLARGLQTLPATATAAWLHAECALEFGPGLIAEDIPETLPSVYRRLGP